MLRIPLWNPDQQTADQCQYPVTSYLHTNKRNSCSCYLYLLMSWKEESVRVYRMMLQVKFQSISRPLHTGCVSVQVVQVSRTNFLDQVPIFASTNHDGCAQQMPCLSPITTTTTMADKLMICLSAPNNCLTKKTKYGKVSPISLARQVDAAKSSHMRC